MIDESPRWPRPESGLMSWAPSLLRTLSEQWGRLAQQVNSLSAGRIASASNANTAAPTTGAWKAGDFVRNSAPSESGTAGSKIVVIGWICVSSGEPGTWVACRALTGN